MSGLAKRSDFEGRGNDRDSDNKSTNAKRLKVLPQVYVNDVAANWWQYSPRDTHGCAGSDAAACPHYSSNK